jgi:hypothetical protein
LYPTQHAAGATLAAVPLRLRGWTWPDLALFWCGAVLIDVDHYLSYVWEFHDLSLVRAYRFHRQRVQRGRGRWRVHLELPRFWPGEHRPFHAVSVLLLLFLLSRRVRWLAPLAWGALFHRCQDYAWESITTVGLMDEGRKTKDGFVLRPNSKV